ncbi:MAG: F0F1 ATP synthase subunit gamma [Gammaproteobacteria bacterium]|nr:F0F1 ATP synthase subunit gamma [Gammaproteobacteria bacterium]
MAGSKEIRSKIKSVKNTQKITRAMEMVAASKMRKAQERMAATRPYSQKMRQVIHHLAFAHSEYKHPYLKHRETVKRVGYIIISSDRGLCGGLNNNEFKATLQHMKQWRDHAAEVEYCTIGRKALNFFKRLKGTIRAQTTQLGDAPSASAVIGPVKAMLDAYNNGEIDRLFMVFNEFVNTMTQSPRIDQLLPVVSIKEEDQLKHYWDYIYEPGAKEILDHLMMRYIESLVYQGLVENVACEMASRMVAMKSASDNAGELIGELQLSYNKARQAAITQEISEIVGGAAAI